MTDWLTKSQAEALAKKHKTPLYAYSRAGLVTRAQELLSQTSPYGFGPRYALKANPHPDIVQLFDSLGLQFDASSEYEASHAISLGVAPEKISLSSQQPPDNLQSVLDAGIKFVASSLHQLELVGQTGWQGDVAIRVNPGLGSGHNNRTTTGGVGASFGIWHEYLEQVLEHQAQHAYTIDRLHVHIGSGGDVALWHSAIKAVLKLVDRLPSVTTLDMGGGYKVARISGESEVDMSKIIGVFNQELRQFCGRTGRRISLEVEPGTWLVANNGVLLSKIVDIVDTGARGFTFIKLDTGMNDFLRPSMYGAQHPIKVLNNNQTKQRYVVVGHNCESGDLLTPAPGEPEQLQPRLLNSAKIGDLVLIGGAGAYGASMRAVGYNSFPSANEVLI